MTTYLYFTTLHDVTNSYYTDLFMGKLASHIGFAQIDHIIDCISG